MNKTLNQKKSVQIQIQNAAERGRFIFCKIWPFYVPAFGIAFILYYFCRTDDSDALKWILTPTAWWVSILSGIPFEYLPHQGYVNHFYQFLIAPSCAGVRFMLITFLMLVFLLLPSDAACVDQKICSIQKECLWFGFSMVFSYLATLFVNGIRIVISIYLPEILERRNLMNGWMTPDRLHTVIGTGTYFTFLCGIYLLAIYIRKRILAPELYKGEQKSAAVPAFWYLFVVLVLPFAKRVYHRNLEGFAPYACVIIVVCGSVCAVMAIGKAIRKGRQNK